MNFQVPQFIEIENKIFGPLSFTQFVFIAGGIAVAFLWYVILPSFYLALIPMLASAGIGLTFALYKINNRSLIYTAQAMIKYALSKKLYLWQKEAKPMGQKTPNRHLIEPDSAAASSTSDKRSRLEQLSWSLDVKENIR